MENKKSPLFDWDAGEFVIGQGRVLTETGVNATEQIVIKAQQTVRGLYLIYADVENPDLNHKYGSDVKDILTRSDLSDDVRISELKRAVKEAIIYDPWVLDVYDVTVTRHGSDSVVVDFTIDTIFDKNVSVRGVEINGQA